MSEPVPSIRLTSRRSLGWLVGGLLLVLAAGGGAVAVAGTPGEGGDDEPAVFRQSNGVVAMNWNAVKNAYYRGQVVPLEQVEDGTPSISAHSIELACHGVIAFFDTEAEEQAYGVGYTARAKVVADKRKAMAPGTDPADTDPCAWWKDPVPGMPGLG